MNKERIGIVGLGYVGLPLAAVMARKFEVVGFDAKAERVDELKGGHDSTGEVDDQGLQSPSLSFTADIRDLGECTFIIVAVPTPIRTPAAAAAICQLTLGTDIGFPHLGL